MLSDWSAAFLRLESVAALMLLAFIVLPLLLYLWNGWPLRRSEIFGTMSDRAVRLYFRQFFPAQALPTRRPTDVFHRHYHRRYGRQHFIVPVLLMLVVVGALSWLAVRTAIGWLSGTAGATGLPTIAVAAVAGAYMWAAMDVISRSRSRAVAPVDLYWWTLRFIIAIPVGFAFAGIFKDEAGAPLAFALGAFPHANAGHRDPADCQSPARAQRVRRGSAERTRKASGHHHGECGALQRRRHLHDPATRLR